jgi:hypothetical protein
MADEQPQQSKRIDPAIAAVEIKITATEADEDTVLALLDKRADEPEDRTVYFFDTPELTLFDNGLVLRARKVDGDDDDSTVKLRPVDPQGIGEDWIHTDAFEVEMDRVGDKEVISAKLSTVQQRGEIDDVVTGQRAIHKLFNADQERLIAEFGPAEVSWEHLVVMGPIDVKKWKMPWPEMDDDVTVERWQLADGSDLVELSFKAKPQEASEVAAAFLDLLTGFGLDVAGDQQTKTKGALAFFTGGEGFD